MTIKQPGKILTEKIKEKDKQITYLKEYIANLQALVVAQDKMIKSQENCLKIQEEMITIYKSG